MLPCSLPWPPRRGVEPAPASKAGRDERPSARSISEPEPDPTPAPSPWLPSSNTRVITIGREPDNDLVIDASIVSGWHARVVVERRAGPDRRPRFIQWNLYQYARQTHRERSTGRDGHRVPRLVPDHGSAHPRNESKPAACTARFLVKFRGKELVFGRGDDCDQVLDFPMVSRRHARLSRTGEQMRIEDLGSSNGTYVNGERIRVREPVIVRPGDRIGLGSYTFTLTLSGDLEERDGRDDLTLEARDLDVDAGDRKLIEGVSLVLRPGEIVGLMGPSGAGKSTLLKSSGRIRPPVAGHRLAKWRRPCAPLPRLRGAIGFVPQEDIIHRDLTVGEALWFTARLRLPGDYSSDEIRRRVADVLAQLDLTGAADVLIGSASSSGISGGQRRRVNLAMELLTDPPVLLLDEPTSGLSSEDALLVMRLLRKLADRGKTILLSIHQPGRDVFRLLDRVAVVARDTGSVDPGKLVYDGPAYPDAIQFFNPPPMANVRPTTEPDPIPDDLLKGLARRPVSDWVDRLAAMRRRRE